MFGFGSHKACGQFTEYCSSGEDVSVLTRYVKFLAMNTGFEYLIEKYCDLHTCLSNPTPRPVLGSVETRENIMFKLVLVLEDSDQCLLKF